MLRPWGLALLLVVCQPDAGHAHSPIPGIEGFYVGLMHPFSTPSQALLVIGLGLFVSGVGKLLRPYALGTFFAATLAGVFTGLWFEDPEAMLFAMATLLCALAATWPRPFYPIALGAVAIGGVLIGQLSIPDPGPSRDRIITMSGSIVGANLGILYIAGGVVLFKERFPHQWIEVGFRVLAAWIGAIALIMLALRHAAENIGA